MDRRTFTSVVGGLVATAGLGAGRASAAEAFDRHDRVEIESWDGTTIVGTLYVPHATGARPAVVLTHGYGGTRASAAATAERYARNGYVALAYDSRGFGDSGGESTFDGPKEVADALSIIDSLASGTVDGVPIDVRPSQNGPAVGMDGGSYAGGIQLNTAAATPTWFEDTDAVDVGTLRAALEHVSLDSSPLDAIVPRITWHDLLQAAAPNGVIKSVWDAFILAVGSEGYTRDGRPDAQGPDPRLYEYTLEAMATNDVSPAAQAYFETRSPDPAAIARNGVATLLVQGWPDNLLPPNQALANFHGIRAADGTAAVAFFPGGHDAELPAEAPSQGAVDAYLDALSLAWLDHHVGDGPGWNEAGFPTVSLYQQQYPDVPAAEADDDWPAWRAATEWPPRDAAPATLDLAATTTTEATLLANSVAPTSARGPTGSLFGAPSADGPVTAAAFDFVATAAVDVVGTPRLRVAVTPLGADAHLFAKVKRVDGTGQGRVIDEQVMPYRLRGEAGERTAVAFDLVAFQRYFERGERLRLVLSTTDNGYSSSRTAAGVLVHHADPDTSTLVVSTVGGALAPVSGQ